MIRAWLARRRLKKIRDEIVETVALQMIIALTKGYDLEKISKLPYVCSYVYGITAVAFERPALIPAGASYPRLHRLFFVALWDRIFGDASGKPRTKAAEDIYLDMISPDFPKSFGLIDGVADGRGALGRKRTTRLIDYLGTQEKKLTPSDPGWA